MRMPIGFVMLGLLFTATSHAQIYRWDNRQVIPGTEGITPGPGVAFGWTGDLSFADLRSLDLENATLTLPLGRLNLTNARFDSSNLMWAEFGAHPLNDGTDLTGASFLGADLSYANFRGAVVSNADFAGATVNGATLGGTTRTGFTAKQLYSTESYQTRNLSGTNLDGNDLNGWDFGGINLSNADLEGSSLKDTNFVEAIVNGTDLGGTTANGFMATQLYSTQSYRAKDLQGIQLWRNDLTNWNFAGQDLTDANLQESTLTGANLAAADLRGARTPNLIGAIVENTIYASGQLDSLRLVAGQRLRIRDDDGVPDPAPAWWLNPRRSISVFVRQQMKVTSGGTVQLEFDADSWGSSISFEPNIPVQLGGTLELTFTDDTQLASQSGRTIKAFDWTGVAPQGQFTISPQPGTAWDTTKLYTTGEVTVLGISSDLDGDKDVDSADLLDFIGNWTGTDYLPADRTWHDGDSDGDGDVDSADMLVFLSQWTGWAAESAESIRVASVPEPNTYMLAVFGWLCVLPRKWRTGGRTL